jgi:PTS system nitrogen regulatory IIA component
MIFALLVPERATDLHLEILAQLAQMFSDRDIRERLATAGSAAEAHQLFVDWSPNAAGQRSATV